MPAIDLPELWPKKPLVVSSPAVRDGAAISRLYSSYGENSEPKIEWASVDSAQSYALIVEDPDAPGARPFVHWIVWNMSTPFSNVAGLTVTNTETGAESSVEGKNDSGTIGYYGPHPPIGDAPHHYHFEVFALNTKLSLARGATRDAVVKAMTGHVLASGEIVGTYEER